MAVGVGIANSVALDNTVVGFGITIFIIGMVMLGRVIEESHIKAKGNSNQYEQ